MKTVAIFAAIVVVTAATAAYADARPQGHQPGAPIKQGKYCWVYTDARGHGWWDVCDPGAPGLTPRGLSLRGRSESEISQIENGSGGDGGGGGGGGGGR